MQASAPTEEARVQQDGPAQGSLLSIPTTSTAIEELKEYVAGIRNKYTGYTKIKRFQAVIKEAQKLKLQDLERLAVETGLRCAYEDDIPCAYVLFSGINQTQQLGIKVENLSWSEQRKRELDQEISKLTDTEKEAAKVKLVKEKTRMCHIAVGDLYYRLGSFNEALKCYSRTRDYCSDASHNLDTCVRVIRSSIGADMYDTVQTWINRGFQDNKNGDAVALSQLHAASALTSMHERKYESAADSFLSVGVAFGDSFNDVITCEEVALYGGLCALASFDRNHLRSKVLSNVNFRSMLESAPSVRDMLNEFVNSQYSELSQRLTNMRLRANADLYLGPCFEELVMRIHRRCLKQYILPFSSASLDLMANVFNAPRDEIERSVSQLIVDKEIEATIDREAGFLDIERQDARQQAFRDTLAIGKTFALNLQASILRSNLQQNGLVYTVESPSAPTRMPLHPHQNMRDDDDFPPEEDVGAGATGKSTGTANDSDKESDVEMDDVGDRSAIATPT
eukprot:CAMPEP_0171537026 /NCGR_PEP_ID=MMETSP0959-20130129/18229_1 /TAXON_ID=87120 /ORGANISM="Aurantiochytrium limacinum, Strain ATCCMYA-1381" /LENGTH=508 /DNA_ID=CAMNT_0012083533 /DNA_START=122 /DNA_END=1649 /DNA_ORIENTATION=+